ncbi:hypothetical protein [Microbacterium sp. 13-71-7]|jgi:predicted small secreted protein|uniref:hypothetical protein n=1 Tax=Microbacterium sp. 13-71-7 TaxID=1970399 RepID=UPI000BCDAD7D|nr:hypothetical protein [Microbacterium sp. 13-71-7]OZB83131.1 MAG: hypothetical protein B7X32_11370 [Microbacterium sp. 13-71-7]
MKTRSVAVALTVLALAAALAACSPTTPGASGGSPSATGSGAASATTTPSSGKGGSPTPTPTSTPVALPKDCTAILSADVRSQLGDIPLNSPAFGPSGVQSDGSLICIWADPKADTTRITTTISRKARGEALDMLNGLVKIEGYSCYTPDKGTRCEKEWPDPTYPVTDGRTLFWRDDVLIDTRYSNLAPTGYTSSIVASVFP